MCQPIEGETKFDSPIALAFFALTTHVLDQLPRYKSEKVLRGKLLQAISSGAGFDLS